MANIFAAIVLGLFAAIIFCLVFIGSPVLAIWCLNTLGVATIPYTVWSWFAMLLLMWIFGVFKVTYNTKES